MDNEDKRVISTVEEAQKAKIEKAKQIYCQIGELTLKKKQFKQYIQAINEQLKQLEHEIVTLSK